LQTRKGLHLKRLFIDRAIPGMERSVQFNLLALATTHHGKRTLGINAGWPAKKGV
jgi:hypothetical protein